MLTTGPVAELEAIYASLPTIACRGLCFDSCGVIPCSRLEAERMRQCARVLPWVQAVSARARRGARRLAYVLERLGPAQ